MDWKNILIYDLDMGMALEIGARTLIMFTLIIVFLRSIGKKGVRQLSIFEIAIIIALGSAAGDPMLNTQSAIVPSIIVFIVILLIYRLITWLAAKYQKVENVLEGMPQYIIEEGKFTLADDGDANFAKDEFFAEMRVQSIEHLGQVKTALLETNGQVSFLFYAHDQVQRGLPVFPKAYLKKSVSIPIAGYYACTNCGNVLELESARSCPRCSEEEWVEALHSPRTV